MVIGIFGQNNLKAHHLESVFVFSCSFDLNSYHFFVEKISSGDNKFYLGFKRRMSVNHVHLYKKRTIFIFMAENYFT